MASTDVSSRETCQRTEPFSGSRRASSRGGLRRHKTVEDKPDSESTQRRPWTEPWRSDRLAKASRRAGRLIQSGLDLIRRQNQMAVAVDNPDEGGAAAQLELSLPERLVNRRAGSLHHRNAHARSPRGQNRSSTFRLSIGSEQDRQADSASTAPRFNLLAALANLVMADRRRTASSPLLWSTEAGFAADQKFADIGRMSAVGLGLGFAGAACVRSGDKHFVVQPSAALRIRGVDDAMFDHHRRIVVVADNAAPSGPMCAPIAQSTFST